MKWFYLILFFVLFFATRADALCVSVSKASARNGPGTWYEKMWDVYRYSPLQKVGVSVSGDWYAVRDMDGYVVWVHKKAVTDRYRCATVKVRDAAIRTGPGTKYSRTSSSPAGRYESFKVLKTKGKWIKGVDEDGKTGWMDKTHLWIR